MATCLFIDNTLSYQDRKRVRTIKTLETKMPSTFAGRQLFYKDMMATAKRNNPESLLTQIERQNLMATHADLYAKLPETTK